jgi:hypothetical protein
LSFPLFSLSERDLLRTVIPMIPLFAEYHLFGESIETTDAFGKSLEYTAINIYAVKSFGDRELA